MNKKEILKNMDIEISEEEVKEAIDWQDEGNTRGIYRITALKLLFEIRNLLKKKINKRGKKK